MTELELILRSLPRAGLATEHQSTRAHQRATRLRCSLCYCMHFPSPSLDYEEAHHIAASRPMAVSQGAAWPCFPHVPYMVSRQQRRGWHASPKRFLLFDLDWRARHSIRPNGRCRRTRLQSHDPRSRATTSTSTSAAAAGSGGRRAGRKSASRAS
jgi:hypothetical protein